MAGIGGRHLGQGVRQHHEEEVGPDASPGTCRDLEGAAGPPFQPGGEPGPLSQAAGSLAAEAVLGGRLEKEGLVPSFQGFPRLGKPDRELGGGHPLGATFWGFVSVLCP